VKIAALTLWQPYASLTALSAKGNEIRSWATSYRGPLAIHAAKRYPPNLRALAEPFLSALAEVALEDYMGLAVAVVKNWWTANRSRRTTYRRNQSAVSWTTGPADSYMGPTGRAETGGSCAGQGK